MRGMTGDREDILRRRPPDICKLVVRTLVWATVVQCVNGIHCKLDETKQWNSSTGVYDCIKCPVCPPGKGLDRPCLNYKKLNESLKCKVCKDGTFSNTNDTATCQACQQCDGFKTLKYCTKTENTQCSTRECEDGFKMENMFGIQMCEPYTKKPRTTSHKPKILVYTTSPNVYITSRNVYTTSPNVDSVKKRLVPRSTQNSKIDDMKVDEETKSPSVNNQGQGGEKWKPNVVTIISICLMICFTFILVYGVKNGEKIWKSIRHFYCSCKRGPDENLNESTPMNPDQQQELEEIVSVPINQQGEGLDPVSSRSPHIQVEGLAPVSPRSPHAQGEGLDPVSPRSPHIQGEGLDPVSPRSPHIQGEGLDPVSPRSPHIQGEGLDPVSPRSPHIQGEGLDPVSPRSPHIQGEGLDPVSPRSPHIQGEGLDPVSPRSPHIQVEGLAPVSSRSPDIQGEKVEKSQVLTPIMANQRLKDISHTLRRKIVLEISKKQSGLKGWREIGEICKISKIELDGMETTSHYSCGSKVPGECLLECLEASKPELTLVEFIEMLRSIEREDVILLICEKMSNVTHELS